MPLRREAGRPPFDESGGFGFVMTVSSLDAVSYELAPKCVLRRASDEEVERIRKTLKKSVVSCQLRCPSSTCQTNIRRDGAKI